MISAIESSSEFVGLARAIDPPAASARRALIQPVTDRPGHDRRYSLDCAKVRALGWAPRRSFEDALRATVEWYREHQDWWRPLKSGAFWEFYQRNYKPLESQVVKQRE